MGRYCSDDRISIADVLYVDWRDILRWASSVTSARPKLFRISATSWKSDIRGSVSEPQGMVNVLDILRV